jgi:hypothetical protein
MPKHNDQFIHPRLHQSLNQALNQCLAVQAQKALGLEPHSGARASRHQNSPKAHGLERGQLSKSLDLKRDMIGA